MKRTLKSVLFFVARCLSCLANALRCIAYGL